MTDNQHEELRIHLLKNLEMLSEVVNHEHNARQVVKQNLANFHAALNERSKVINDTLDRKRADDLAALDDQITQLRNFLSHQTSE